MHQNRTLQKVRIPHFAKRQLFFCATFFWNGTNRRNPCTENTVRCCTTPYGGVLWNFRQLFLKENVVLVLVKTLKILEATCSCWSVNCAASTNREHSPGFILSACFTIMSNMIGRQEAHADGRLYTGCITELWPEFSCKNCKSQRKEDSSCISPC